MKMCAILFYVVLFLIFESSSYAGRHGNRNFSIWTNWNAWADFFRALSGNTPLHLESSQFDQLDDVDSEGDVVNTEVNVESDQGNVRPVPLVESLGVKLGAESDLNRIKEIINDLVINKVDLESILKYAAVHNLDNIILLIVNDYKFSINNMYLKEIQNPILTEAISSLNEKTFKTVETILSLWGNPCIETQNHLENAYFLSKKIVRYDLVNLIEKKILEIDLKMTQPSYKYCDFRSGYFQCRAPYHTIMTQRMESVDALQKCHPNLHFYKSSTGEIGAVRRRSMDY